MNNYLAQLVFEYSVNKKFADSEFINKVLSKLLVDELNIIEPIIQEDSPNNLKKYATKYYYSKEIHIFLNNMKDMLSNEMLYCNQIMYSSNINNLDDEEIKNILLFQYNLSVIRVLLFQIEHIKRYINYNLSDNLEDILFDLGAKIKIRHAYMQNKICSKELIIDDSRFSNEFFKDSDNFSKYKLLNNEYRQLMRLQGLNGVEPSNRFANIKSVRGIDLIINKLNVEDNIKENLILLNNYYKMYFMFTNYYSNERLLLDPLKRYINLLMLMREYSTEKYTSEELDCIIESNNNLPIDKKIYYGLGLTSEEYNSTCRGKVKII